MNYKFSLLFSPTHPHTPPLPLFLCSLCNATAASLHTLPPSSSLSTSSFSTSKFSHWQLPLPFLIPSHFSSLLFLLPNHLKPRKGRVLPALLFPSPLQGILSFISLTLPWMSLERGGQWLLSLPLISFSPLWFLSNCPHSPSLFPISKPRGNGTCKRAHGLISPFLPSLSFSLVFQHLQSTIDACS